MEKLTQQAQQKNSSFLKSHLQSSSFVYFMWKQISNHSLDKPFIYVSVYFFKITV